MIRKLIESVIFAASILLFEDHSIILLQPRIVIIM